MPYVFDGKLIKHLREGNRMSVTGFAIHCGLSRQTVQEIEGGDPHRKPSVRILEKIMTRFPVTPGFFFVERGKTK